jgi:hypothetical protein
MYIIETPDFLFWIYLHSACILDLHQNFLNFISICSRHSGHLYTDVTHDKHVMTCEHGKKMYDEA